VAGLVGQTGTGILLGHARAAVAVETGQTRTRVGAGGEALRRILADEVARARPRAAAAAAQARAIAGIEGERAARAGGGTAVGRVRGEDAGPGVVAGGRAALDIGGVTGGGAAV